MALNGISDFIQVYLQYFLHNHKILARFWIDYTLVETARKVLFLFMFSAYLMWVEYICNSQITFSNRKRFGQEDDKF